MKRIGPTTDEAYLEILDENVVEINDAANGKFVVVVGDELTCEVSFDVCPADPDVGFMEGHVELTAVEHKGVDMSPWFDEDRLVENFEPDDDCA